MYQNNLLKLIELIKSNTIPKLHRKLLLGEFLQKFDGELNDVINELHTSNIDLQTYLPVILTKIRPIKMYKLIYSLNTLNINYSKYLRLIINNCDPNMMDELVNSLNNNPNIDYSKHLKSIINRCNPNMIYALVDSLNTNPNIDYSKHLKSIINNCIPNMIDAVVDSLNNNASVDYSKHLKSILHRCDPSIIEILIDSLNTNSNIDYSKHLILIINKCYPHQIDNLIDSFNKPGLNFKKILSSTSFDKITNIKTIQRITTNVLFSTNTPNLISQISFILENIKDPSLSGIDGKKIININNLIKKIYTTENKKDLYKMISLSSQSQTSYTELLTSITEKLVNNFYDRNLGIDIHKRKKLLNSNLDKDIRFGLEIETVGLGQNKLSNLTLNEFSYQLDGSIYNYNKRTNLVSNSGNDTAELVSEKLDPYNKDNISNIYDTCETLRKNCASTNFTCGLHVHVSGKDISKYNPKILDDILSDMVFMQKILIEKLNIYSSRTNSYINLIPSNFLGKSLDFLKYCTKNKYPNKHYMLNLVSLDKYGTLEFRLFNLPDAVDTNMVLAYADMATSMVNSARKKGSFYNRVQNMFNLKNIDLNNKNLVNLVYNEFLDYIDVSKESKKTLKNMDKIFSFYKAKEPKDPKLTGQIIDFHTPQNNILQPPVTQINISNKNESSTERSLYCDTLYCIEKKTLLSSEKPKDVYFYPYKNIDKNIQKQLTKQTKKLNFYPKSIDKDKEPYCLQIT